MVKHSEYIKKGGFAMSPKDSHAAFYEHIVKIFGNEKALMGRKEELKLIRLAKRGDKKAMNEILAKNYRMVLKALRPYLGIQGIEPDDLFSEGLMAIRQAVKKFKLRSGNRLMTYAIWWMKAYMRRHIHMHGKNIRIPVHVAVSAGALRRAASKMKTKNGEYPAGEEFFAIANLGKKSTAHKKNALRVYLSKEISLSSMSTSADREERTLLDVCEADRDGNPDAVYGKEEERALLKLALSRLSPKGEFVLKQRFFGDCKLQEIAELMVQRGLASSVLTRERIRQIESKALVKLKKILRQKYGIRNIKDSVG